MTDEQTALVPAVRGLVVLRADLASYRDTVLAEAHTRVARKTAALIEAHEGIDAANAAGEYDQCAAWQRRYTHRLKPLERAQQFLSAVEAGYLPIPRMPARRFWRDDTVLPPAALQAMAEAKSVGAFETFVLVDGNDDRTPGHRYRDPILCGVADGEMFPVAWWR